MFICEPILACCAQLSVILLHKGRLTSQPLGRLNLGRICGRRFESKLSPKGNQNRPVSAFIDQLIYSSRMAYQLVMYCFQHQYHLNISSSGARIIKSKIVL